MTSPRKRIQIIEDDDAVRVSLKAMLATWGYDVQPFASAEDFLASGICDPADCLLLDVKLTGMDGLALLSAVRQRGVTAPVIILTGHGDVRMAVSALKAGARDFLEKPVDARELVECIRAAITEHERTYRGCGKAFARLTRREMEVLREIVTGHSNKVIAFRLQVSPKTVEVHRARVMQKSGAGSLPELVRMAVRAGIDPDAAAD